METIQQAITYDNILLHDFIETVIGGTVDAVIYDEFFFAVRTSEQAYAMRLTQQINILESKYGQVILIVRFLELHAGLKKSYPGDDLPDADAVFKILQSIIPVRRTDSFQVITSRATRLLSERKQKEKELEQVNQLTDGKPLDRRYFNRLVAGIQTFHKTPINRRTTLLCEFVEMWLMAREQAEEMDQQIKKAKR